MEVWEFINEGGGGMGMMGMMNMPHPIHLHGKQFKVLEWRGVQHEGYVDEGWKDTVLLMPGERIKILVRFGDYPGLFLYHCHNLEHEDLGMMRNYLVKGSAASVFYVGWILARYKYPKAAKMVVFALFLA